MKKTLSLILALLLVLSLFAGCGSKGEKIDISELENHSKTDSDTSVSDKPDASTSDKPDASTSDKPDASTSDKPAVTGFTTGTWDGDVFTNDWAGIKYTLPSDWTKSSDKDIADLMGVAADAIGSDLTKIAQLTTVYDAMAKSALGDNVIIMYENLAISGATNYTVDDYLTVLTNQMNSLSGTTGIKYTFSDYQTVTLSGVEFKRVSAETDMGMTQYYYVRRVDNYMCCVIATSVSGITSADFEAQF